MSSDLKPEQNGQEQTRSRKLRKEAAKHARRDLISNGPLAWRGTLKGRVWRAVSDFGQLYSHFQIGVKSASITYYVLLALFPMIILLMSLAAIIGQRLEINPETLDAVKNLLPQPILAIINTFVVEVSTSLSITSISITVLVVLWAAGRGLGQIFQGVETIYPDREGALPLPSRIIGVFFTLIFLLLLFLATILMSFGRALIAFLNTHLRFLVFSDRLLNLITYGAGFLLIFVMFLSIFYVAAKRSDQKMRIFPGAFFTTLGWILLTYLYSFYISNKASLASIYGSLANIIILMLWLNFCAQIILAGAVINYQATWHKKSLSRYLLLVDAIKTGRYGSNPLKLSREVLSDEQRNLMEHSADRDSKADPASTEIEQKK